MGDFWKYRVGDYRIIASIKDERVTVLVVRTGTGAPSTANRSWPIGRLCP